MFFDDLFPALVGCLTSFVLAALIILTQRWHGLWTYDHQDGIQKFHSQPTPRIGGLAVVVGTFVSGFILDVSTQDLILPILISGLIPFFVGFKEDLTKQVSVKARLLAIIVGAVAAMLLTKIYLNHLDVAGIDYLLVWWPVGALVTIIAVSGVTNAINILDGFNGLASGTAMIILSFLALMAFQSDDYLLTGLSLMLVGSLLGFMLLNYPFGKIFLGDAGAYFVGFLVAWIALLLPMRNEEVSPWACLLTCAYPVVEVLYSMVRRAQNQLKTGEPDNLHLHTLIKTRVVRYYFTTLPNWAKNSLVAPSIWMCCAVLGFVATHFAGKVPVLTMLFGGFLLWYHWTYQYLLKLPEIGSHDE